jgi:hypothetical protein
MLESEEVEMSTNEAVRVFGGEAVKRSRQTGQANVTSPRPCLLAPILPHFLTSSLPHFVTVPLPHLLTSSLPYFSPVLHV